MPRVVVKLQELPRNPSGKVLKTQLRTYSLDDAVRLESDDDSAPNAAQSQLREPSLRNTLLTTHAASRKAACVEFVQHLVQHVSGEQQVLDPDTRLLEAGLDSLMMVEISNQIQVEVGPDIPVASTLVFDQPRISDLGDYLLATIMPEQPSAKPERQSGSGERDDRSLTSAPAPTDQQTLQQQVAELSEEEALAELMKELSES